MVEVRVKSGHLTREQADRLVKDYENDINRYTYLE